MFEHFQLRHIPALFAATTTTFGGLWPLFDPRGSLHEFGFTSRIADSPAAAPVMIIGCARTSILGILMFYYYSRGQLEVVDTILGVFGAYAGLIDSYVVWKEGNLRKAIFRFVSSGLLSAWAFSGQTAGR
ncbi:hypothetical protein JX265_000356 [Neoarthrinium moseri]|uniref:Uncharacterized protein n=1 Tax=Neoarthrinium moseri TaxID=1658444 RepID=A0A9P9WYW4_9PEZI|nr:uncharacterized protein JN550_000606 [Neoarthrinium moseri]KAI1851410.1 hypothetical protein JX266_003485 [Neoarthrinium moseri]KAI1878424.1 hypothetical protein JN550_000606 [Neoarthrinium moseri]KAI1881530.1 hypothetical protein JX265_000356 [Neoarthrinium moseri]